MERELEFIRIDINKLLYNYCVLNGIECCLDEITPDEWNGLSSQQRKEIGVLIVLYETFAESATGLSILGV